MKTEPGSHDYRFNLKRRGGLAIADPTQSPRGRYVTPASPFAHRSRSQTFTVDSDDIGIPMSRILKRPFLRREVYVDKAEPLVITFRPLEIVEQRPVKVPLDGNGLGFGPAKPPQIPPVKNQYDKSRAPSHRQPPSRANSYHFRR